MACTLELRGGDIASIDRTSDDDLVCMVETDTLTLFKYVKKLGSALRESMPDLVLLLLRLLSINNITAPISDILTPGNKLTSSNTHEP